MSQESLELDILNWIAQQSKDDAIRAQCATARVVSRDFTGNGSYSKLTTSNRAKKSPLGVADAAPLIESSELPLGGGANLTLENGLIDLLEIYMNGGDKYPDDIKDYRLFDFKS